MSSWLNTINAALKKYGEAKEELDRLVAVKEAAELDVAAQKKVLEAIEDKHSPTVIDHRHELPEGLLNELRAPNGKITITPLTGLQWPPDDKKVINKLLSEAGGSLWVKLTAEMTVQRGTELQLFGPDGEPVRDVKAKTAPIKRGIPESLAFAAGAKARRNEFSLKWHPTTAATTDEPISRGSTGGRR